MSWIVNPYPLERKNNQGVQFGWYVSEQAIQEGNREGGTQLGRQESTKIPTEFSGLVLISQRSYTIDKMGLRDLEISLGYRLNWIRSRRVLRTARDTVNGGQRVQQYSQSGFA